jgi:hypothetical protein
MYNGYALARVSAGDFQSAFDFSDQFTLLTDPEKC